MAAFSDLLWESSTFHKLLASISQRQSSGQEQPWARGLLSAAFPQEPMLGRSCLLEVCRASGTSLADPASHRNQWETGGGTLLDRLIGRKAIPRTSQA